MLTNRRVMERILHELDTTFESHLIGLEDEDDAEYTEEIIAAIRKGYWCGIFACIDTSIRSSKNLLELCLPFETKANHRLQDFLKDKLKGEDKCDP